MAEKNNDKLISIGDIVLLFIIISLCAGMIIIFGLNKTKGKTVRISVDGEKVKTMALDEDYEYRVETPQGHNIVVVKDGVVRVTEADCPDKICVNHKPVSDIGETIICLPHKVVVEVVE